MKAPVFTVIGDGRLSDEAIEALAALLLSVRDQAEEDRVEDQFDTSTEAEK